MSNVGLKECPTCVNNPRKRFSLEWDTGDKYYCKNCDLYWPEEFLVLPQKYKDISMENKCINCGIEKRFMSNISTNVATKEIMCWDCNTSKMETDMKKEIKKDLLGHLKSYLHISQTFEEACDPDEPRSILDSFVTSMVELMEEDQEGN